MTRDEAIAYLNKDGDLGVPCGRYGRSTYECSPIAYDVALYVESETDAEMGPDLLEYAMGLVVNSHDDVAYILDNMPTT